MSDGFEARLGNALAGWVDRVQRRPLLTVLGVLVLVALGLAHAAANLGIQGETAVLFSDRLPFKQAEAEYYGAFPNQYENMFVVVDGPTPEAAGAAAQALTKRLAAAAHRAYRFRDLVAAGARLEFGSDAPVSPLDPWAAIAAAVRRTADDRPAWHPDQRLGVATALAASARGRHDLHVGDPADLAVLDDDPLRVDTSVLADPDVHATMVDGRFTHGP